MEARALEFLENYLADELVLSPESAALVRTAVLRFASHLERTRAQARFDRIDAVTERIFASSFDGAAVDWARDNLVHDPSGDRVRAELERRAQISLMAADALLTVAVLEPGQ